MVEHFYNIQIYKMYIAQNIEHPERFLISPDDYEESWTTDPGLAYKWKSLAGCKVWCGGCGGGEWKPIEFNGKKLRPATKY